MAFKLNNYYNISSIGQEALVISETILKSYPLTKMFSEILGKRLLSRLEFGFFKPDFKVIEQGDKGKDLFLICDHKVKVVVNKQVIVTMPAPALLGDKGIIDRESIRSATIAVADGGNCFVIKIPMGVFIRDAKRADIRDEEYSQEMKVFYNLFKEVQSRLFKYSMTQKNLWEEVNAQINSLNIQLVSKILNKKEDTQWDEKVWQVGEHYLRTVHGIEVSEEEQLNVSSFVGHLQTVVDKALPPEKFQGQENLYMLQKSTLWKNMLEKISGLMVKVLPDDQLPINLGEVELFNPRNYQTRMINLLASIEEKFMFTKVKPKSEDFDRSSISINNFFGKDIEENEFDLPSYLFTMKKNFSLRHPNRILSQIAQQTAQLTAKCENEFNASVSKMQKFLEKIKKLTHIEQKKEKSAPVTSKKAGEAVSIICKGLNAYNRRLSGAPQQYLGEIRLNDMSTPMHKDIIKTCASDPLKKNMDKAFNIIADAVDLKTGEFGVDKIKEQFYLCEASYKDIIPPQQFSAHYWIPVTEAFGIWKDKTHVRDVKPGMVLGGETWQTIKVSDVEESESWHLKMPETKSSIESENLTFIFAVPEKNVCWRNKSVPSVDEFKRNHLPFAQWIINKHLGTITELIKTRNNSFEKYSKVVEIIQTEKKVREFETSQNTIDDQQYQKIIDLIYDNLGVSLEKKADMTSDEFSEMLYESIVEQTKSDFPTLSAEEQGNKAYTIWRFIQSEIVTTVYQDESEETGIVTPEPVLKELRGKIDVFLKEASIKSDEEIIDLSEENPYIKIMQTLQAKADSMEVEDQIKLIGSIITAIESVVRTTMEEVGFYRSRLKKVSSINTDFDVAEVQSKLVTESVKKLQKLLTNKK
ncbi:MAG: hypothetical protein GY866_43490 [Proteobacteria bacterium]|nr:hypothetical protein [Pseudomonadota bacterium]